jgi:hypothetical protein
MDFVQEIIEFVGAFLILRFRNEKSSIDDVIRGERLKVWIVGLISILIFLTLIGAIAKYGFKS